MSNHYHIVACIDKESALALPHLQVVERWSRQHIVPPLIQRFITGTMTLQSEIDTCTKIIEIWRHRLYSLSWFMKELNYEIAVQANKEDECTGRFWEGRFKSQALLDEKALIAAMAYVDLNPIRAQQAKTPEKSDYTSIKYRLLCLEQGKTSTPFLADFIGHQYKTKAQGIPFRFIDYIELVDWLGRQIRYDKPGSIDNRKPMILKRLSLGQQECLKLCTELGSKPRLWIGSSQKLRHAKVKLNRKRMVGIHIS